MIGDFSCTESIFFVGNMLGSLSKSKFKQGDPPGNDPPGREFWTQSKKPGAIEGVPDVKHTPNISRKSACSFCGGNAPIHPILYTCTNALIRVVSSPQTTNMSQYSSKSAVQNLLGPGTRAGHLGLVNRSAWFAPFRDRGCGCGAPPDPSDLGTGNPSEV